MSEKSLMKLFVIIGMIFMIMICAGKCIANNGVYKVAVIGTHGCGKTSLCYKITSELKKAGFNAICVNENSRECPFQINENKTNNASLWIAHNQIVQELNAVSYGYTHIVCDRSTIDAIAYGIDNFKSLNYNTQWLIDWVDTYDKIIFIYPDVCLTKLDQSRDKIRSKSEPFRQNIHKNFIMIIKKWLNSKQKRKIQNIMFSDIKNDKINVKIENGMVFL